MDSTPVRQEDLDLANESERGAMNVAFLEDDMALPPAPKLPMVENESTQSHVSKPSYVI